jgi:hypothetical protein
MTYDAQQANSPPDSVRTDPAAAEQHGEPR